MRILTTIIALFFFIASQSQEKQFFVVDNTFHKTFKNKKVKTLKSYKTDLLDGGIEGKYLEIVRDFDVDGNIIKEREYYSKDSTDGFEIKHTYDNNHRLIKTEWFWLDDNKIEITEYEYNEKGRLSKSCDYVKNYNSVSPKLEFCEKYMYRNGYLKKVKSTNDNNNKMFFKKGNSIIEKGGNKKQKLRKYINGNIVYEQNNFEITKYERNIIGQPLKIETRNKEQEIVTTYIFEYKNELLIKTIKKNSVGREIEFDEIEYEYFK